MTTIRRMFFIWDFDKQTAWLNDMAKKGLNLHSVGFNRFDFAEGSPGEYCYRMEWLKQWPTRPESVSYIRFMETGDRGRSPLQSAGEEIRAIHT
jgi:hypothetical protein